MGSESVEVVRVIARVSRHNSPEDARDDELVAEIAQRVEELIAEPRYQPIGPMIA